MVFRLTATIAVIAALVSLAVYWFISRPTPEENALTGMFDEFQKGEYIESQKYTLNNDFYTMAAQTSVRDTDGEEYLIGDFFPENRSTLLQIAIETYVRQNISRWKYLSLDTQRPEENHSVVHFRIEVGVRDYSSGEVFGTAHEGRVEGIAHMEMQEGEWKVKSLEFSIFSDEGLVLSNYLKQVGAYSSFGS